jgi:hypothetical protein
MQAKWGIAWLAAVFWLVVGVWAPMTGLAAVDSPYTLPILTAGAQGSLETQMLGEQPLKPATPRLPGAQALPSLQLHQNGGDARLSLPLNTEMHISIRYNRDPNPAEPQRLNDSPLYMKYAMDYRLMSNLRVGLNSYLYRPAEEGFAFQRPLANQLLGVGPEIKYDLGRWSFLLKSQVETGNRDQGKDLQNWFRVWYAF